MTLRWKTLLIIGIALLGMIGILYLVSSKLILSSFADLEEQRTSENVERAANALSDDISGIDTMTNDWASWDDTYAFIQDRNQKYIESNPTDEAFTGLRLNVMLFINSSGELVFGKAFDLKDEQEIPVPQSLMEHLSVDDPLVHHITPDDNLHGIIFLTEGPMLVASEPILTSNAEGPSRGTLIMGRYLDATEIERLAKITRLSIDIQRPDESNLPSDFEAANASLSGGKSIIVTPLDKETVAGYTLLNDIYGKPVLLLRVDMPRDIYQHGENTLLYFVFGLLGIGLIFFILTLVLMGKLVLSPMSRLSADVSSVAVGGEPTARVRIVGKDELSSLAAGINKMLRALERSHETLRESEQQYAALVGSLTDAVFKTREMVIVWCNDNVERIYGYKKEELLGKEVTLLFPEGVNASELISDISAAIRKRGFFAATARVRKKDGGTVDLEYAISIIPGTKPIELVAVARDITERKRAEEEKQKLEQQLNLAGRLAAIGELAAGVAHELNNPLTAIQGFAQLLTNEDDLDGTVKKQVATIYKEAQRASKITRNLLAFAREHKPEKQLVSINDVVTSTLDMCAYRMKANNIDLIIELEPDLPKTMADFQQMQQVFLNIVNNAEQAMVEAHGKGKLIARTLKVDDMIQIVFTDDGPGISEQDLKRIFEPFFTTKEVGKGTGLGLSICYGIVEAHGGHIYAESKPGEGATFVVELPITSEDSKVRERVGLTQGQ